MLKSWSSSLIARGVLAFIVGIVAIVWPGVTILALVILFAVYAFMDAGIEGARAFSSDGAGSVFGHLLMSLVDIAAGIIALAWPGATAEVLVIIVAVWAFVGGFAEVFAAFQSGETAGMRAFLILGGLISIAFGFVCADRPNVGAVTLALLFGLYAMVYGVSLTVMGIQGRSAGNSLDSAISQITQPV